VNTVDEAQKAWRLVGDCYPGAFEQAIVFHSRFTAAARSDIEARVLSLFGKDGLRPKGRSLLIATQVVEQSLDLDFDLMMSTIAPLDLLLQRSGRLHRHPRVRPESHATPVLMVRLPEEADDAPSYGSTGKIYAPAILMRTQVLLQRTIRPGGSFHIPGQVSDAIDFVYGSEPQEGIPSKWSKRYGEELGSLQREEARRENIAAGRMLPSPLGASFEDAWEPQQWVSEDKAEVEASGSLTRLGDENLQVVCLHRIRGEIYFDSRGERPCPTTGHFSPNQIRAFLGQSARLPGYVKRAIHAADSSALADSEVWRSHRALRYLNPVIFEDGRCPLEKGLCLLWDETEGINVQWSR
jgi:CRISPR-associated endonuclease/helicase Cas3